MLYLDRKPGPPLDAFVASIWYCENDPRPQALERVLPSGAAQFIVNLKEDQTRLYRPASGYRCETSPGAVLSLQTRFCVIDTTEQECVIGVVFKPGGTVPFFRVATRELRDVEMPLDGFREQLLEAPNPQAKLGAMERLLTERFTLPRPHPAVSFAIAAFRAPAQYRGRDQPHRPKSETLHRTLQSSRRRHPQTLLPHPKVPAHPGHCGKGARRRLDRRRPRLRLLRPSPFHPRFPLLLRHHTHRLPDIENRIPQSRQISTILRRRIVRRCMHG